MPHKKNGFWTFMFSLLPGAGEMYLGFMKQGISLMTLFFGIIAFCAFFSFDVGLFILPIVWFYSFFHVLNLNGLPDEEFCQVEDEYLFQMPELEKTFQLSRKKELIMAYGCIIIGIYALWRLCLNVLIDLIPWEIYDRIYAVSRILPQSILSLFLIMLGIHLIRGKKTQLDREEQQETQESFFSNEKNTDSEKEPAQTSSCDDFNYENK